MRRLSLLLAVCLVSLVAACGGDDESGGPLDSALSYVPEGTPFVVAIDTDLEGDQYGSVQSILNQFPGGVNIEDLLRDQLASGVDGVSYEEDVKPLLGNPFVVSATEVTSFLDDSEDDDFVAAIQVKDGEALDRVIDATAPEQSGEVAGATVYEDDGTFFAVDDDMVVFAGSRELLEAALERAEAGEGLDRARLRGGVWPTCRTRRSPAFTSTSKALIDQDPDTEAARKVDWVAALRTLGMTASAKDDAIELELNLRTDGEDLSDEILPLAAGDEAPGVVRREGEFGFGLRDPSQLIGFFESALQAIDPADLRRLRAGQAGHRGELRHRPRRGRVRPDDRRPVGVGDDRRLLRRPRRGGGPGRVRADDRQGRGGAAGAGRQPRGERGRGPPAGSTRPSSPTAAAWRSA